MTNETLLYRQVHPSWLHDGRPSSQAFRPTPKDDSRLSVDNGDQVSAEQSHVNFTADRSESCGVLAVTMQECAEADRPVEADPPPPEHCVILFVGLTKGQVESASKKLKNKALARGWVYQPPVE